MSSHCTHEKRHGLRRNISGACLICFISHFAMNSFAPDFISFYPNNRL
jgi:hypothetical protein